MKWNREGEDFALSFTKGGSLHLFAERKYWADQETIILMDQSRAEEHNEEPLQLIESCAYQYELPDGYSFKAIDGIVQPILKKKNLGRITPGIWVGRLGFTIEGPDGKNFETAVEVRSIKTGYRTEYHTMLEDIAVRCTDLLMSHSSPVTQRFMTDHDIPSKTLYQRFAFVKSIADSDEFRNAVHRILAMPVTAWKQTVEERDIRRAGRITPSQLRQIASRTDRIEYSLSADIKSVPAKLTTTSKTDSVDTPENRFVKHALREFSAFCGMVRSHIERTSSQNLPIYAEAKGLEERLAEYLNHSVFREVGVLRTLPLNSPVLQRKEGYREVLRVWLMFDLAAKLSWSALDADRYDAGKRDVASLYEYWVFFKLLEVVKSVFSIEPEETEQLLQATSDGMGLQLRQGRHLALTGSCTMNQRKLKVSFHYNRTFSQADYPGKGSWTQQMRPDYTLTLWPAAFSENEAERQELIVHIHFDAKYKVEALRYLIDEKNSPEEPDDFDSLPVQKQEDWLKSANQEKREEKEGTYKRADLLKMHAYKDAIRRTGGAYIIYPGSKVYGRKGFHEIIPGLGAFPLSPSKSETGSEDLRKFIMQVVENFTNRTSQHEQVTYHTYDIMKNNASDAVREKLPEMCGAERVRPAGEITVLVGYCKSEEHYEWMKRTRLYNIRLDKETGPEKIDPELAGAEYLLLHKAGAPVTGELWRIKDSRPRVFTREELADLDYPTKPTQPNYLVYNVANDVPEELKRTQWDIRKLAEHKAGRGSSRPFAVTLSELMGAKT